MLKSLVAVSAVFVAGCASGPERRPLPKDPPPDRYDRGVDKYATEPAARPPAFSGKLVEKGDDGYTGVVAAIFSVGGCSDAAPQIWLMESERGGIARIGATACGRNFNCMGFMSMKNDLTDGPTKCFELAPPPAPAAPPVQP